MNQLPTILKELIPKKGKNKSDVARLLGISSQLLGQYEKGGRKPGGDFFLKWRQVFGEDLLKLIETKDSGSTHIEYINSNPLPGTATLQDLLNEKDQRIIDAQREKERLYNLVERLTNIYEDNIRELRTNSAVMIDQLQAIGLAARAEHGAIMASLDRVEKNEIGTNAKAAGISEVAAQKIIQDQKTKGKHVHSGK